MTEPYEADLFIEQAKQDKASQDLETMEAELEQELNKELLELRKKFYIITEKYDSDIRFSVYCRDNL